VNGKIYIDEDMISITDNAAIELSDDAHVAITFIADEN
jgi:hypothetical protein